MVGAGAHRLASVPLGEAERHALLQRRVALFAKITCIIGLSFLVAEKAVTVIAGASATVWVASELVQLGGCVLLLAGWQLVKRAPRLSATALLVLDTSIVLAACLAWAGVAVTATSPFAAHDAAMAMAFTVLCRAIVVPSQPRHTLLIAALSSSLMPWVGWWVAAAGTTAHSAEPGLAPVELGLQLGLWAAVTTAGATITSAVIHGLRERVRESSQLGQYTLEHKIGEGGMGVVYKARHALLRRPTAIKLIDRLQVSDIRLRRFEREVQSTSQLSHPNTVAVYDYGRTHDGVFYYAMEYLEGLDLDDLVRLHGPLPAGRAVHLLRQVCGALAEAHAAGLVHRDVKPANLMLCRRGGQPDVIKVLDFGLVKEMSDEVDSVGTAPNVIAGSPHYIAPEAIKSADLADARTDLYGVGCVAYFLLTGKPVFDGDHIVDVCSKHLHDTPAPPSRLARGTVSPELDDLVLRCLAKSPADRPAEARELESLLASCPDVQSWSQRQAEDWWSQLELADEDAASPSSTLPLTLDVNLSDRREPLLRDVQAN